MVASNNVSLSLGLVVFNANTTATGLVVGAYYQISLAGSPPQSEYMQGVMTSLNATSIVVNITTVTGTPAVVGNAWTFAVLSVSSSSSSSPFSSSSSSSSSSSPSPSTFYGATSYDNTQIGLGINTWNVTNTSGLNTGDKIEIQSMQFMCGASYNGVTGTFFCFGYVVLVESPYRVTLNLTTCTNTINPLIQPPVRGTPWWISPVPNVYDGFQAYGQGLVTNTLGLQTFNVSEFYNSFGESGQWASHGSYYNFDSLQVNGGIQITVVGATYGFNSYLLGVIVFVDFPLFTVNMTMGGGGANRWSMHSIPC